MMKVLASVAIFSVTAILASASSMADDGPKFNYVDGQCVDKSGNPGLNKDYVGDCGDLNGKDLSGKNLTGKTFRGANLQNANLQKAQVQNDSFDSADLTGAKLQGIVADSASFVRANLSGATLDGGSFKSATFGTANFQGTSAKTADFTSAKFSASMFYDAIFEGANLGTASFAGNDLSFADFMGAKIGGADFTGASFYQTDFSKATGDTPTFYQATIRESSFAGAVLKAPSFSSSEIVDTTLDGMQAANGKFLSTLVRTSSLLGTTVDASDFRMARFEDSELKGASFANADFRMSHLQATGWMDATMKGAKINSRTQHSFTDADIKKAGIILVSKGSEVGMLYDPSYVDVDVGDRSSAEATNLMKLLGADLTLQTTKYSPAQIGLDLDAVGVYVVPELEAGQLPLSDAEVVSFKTFVTDGGNLILFNTASQVLGRILGTSLDFNYGTTYSLDPTVAAGLGLEGLDPTLNDLSATYSMNPTDLPAETQIFYGKKEGFATVFMVPMGKGKIWYVAWDFYDWGQTDATGWQSWDKLVHAIVTRATAVSLGR